jgi:ribosomal protein S18 acetylase RimI-like enzyme
MVPDTEGGSGRITRAFRTARTRGPVNLWFRILGEIAYRRVVVLECRLDGELPEIAARVPVRIALLTSADLEHFARFRPGLEPSVVRRRLEQGHQCFVAWHAGEIVHAGWAATRQAWVEYLGCEFPLGPGDVYQYDSFTAPAFRGLDLAGARVAWMTRFFRDVQARRLLAVVWPENTAAFRPLEKAGYRRCGWLRVIWLGSWRRAIYSPSR